VRVLCRHLIIIMESNYCFVLTATLYQIDIYFIAVYGRFELISIATEHVSMNGQSSRRSVRLLSCLHAIANEISQSVPLQQRERVER
jgi:hypothetical protein